jgi:hypothetical protein
MSVRVSLIGVSQVKSFPKLMIDGELIVFFVKSGTGIVLRAERVYKVGEYSDRFDTSCFKDYDGLITLMNE